MIYMKSTLFLWLFTLPMSIFAQAGGIKFDNPANWSSLKAKAVAEHKMIFLDCFTTWCGPCKQMDSQVYPDADLGDFMNAHFIAVKLQFDQTPHDDMQTRGWYTDVKTLREKYEVQAFPTLLFLDPEGQVVHRQLGLLNARDLLQQAKFALDPARESYQRDIAAYKNGKKDVHKLFSLYTTSKNVFRDTALTNRLAADYREFLSTQNDSVLLDRQNLRFMGSNSPCYHADSRYGKLLNEKSEHVDSVMGKGYAKVMLTKLIKQDLQSRLWQGQTIVDKHPDWSNMRKEVAGRYPNVDAAELVLDLQIGPVSANGMPDGYYHVSRNYRKLVALTQPRIDHLANQSVPDSFMINCIAYWSIFVKVPHDRFALSSGLRWSELALAIDRKKGVQNDQLMDTRANLLYKLGRKTEAIAQEKQAVSLLKKQAKKSKTAPSPFLAADEATILLMKQGKPTGLADGAKW